MTNAQATYTSQHTKEEYSGQFKFVWVMGICPNTASAPGGEPVSPTEAWPAELSPSRAPIVGVDFYPADGVRSDGREIRCYAANDPGPKPTEPQLAKPWEEAMLQDWLEGWENIEANDTWDLKHWAEFAKAKNQRLAMTQWAVTTQEDKGSNQSNFVFVRRLARFVFGPGHENPDDVVFSDYFDPEGRLPPTSPEGTSAQPQAAACYQFKFFDNERVAEKCPNV